MKRKRAICNIPEEDLDRIEKKLVKYEMTLSEYLKFLLGFPDRYTVRWFLQTSRSKYNVGDTFHVKDILPEDVDKPLYFNFCKKCYSYIREHDCGFEISNSVPRTVLRTK